MSYGVGTERTKFVLHLRPTREGRRAGHARIGRSPTADINCQGPTPPECLVGSDTPGQKRNHKLSRSQYVRASLSSETMNQPTHCSAATPCQLGRCCRFGQLLVTAAHVKLCLSRCDSNLGRESEGLYRVGAK